MKQEETIRFGKSVSEAMRFFYSLINGMHWQGFFLEKNRNQIFDEFSLKKVYKGSRRIYISRIKLGEIWTESPIEKKRWVNILAEDDNGSIFFVSILMTKIVEWRVLGVKCDDSFFTIEREVKNEND